MIKQHISCSVHHVASGSFPVAPEAVLTRTHCIIIALPSRPRNLHIISPQSFIIFEEQISRDWERVCVSLSKPMQWNLGTKGATTIMCFASPATAGLMRAFELALWRVTCCYPVIFIGETKHTIIRTYGINFTATLNDVSTIDKVVVFY